MKCPLCGTTKEPLYSQLSAGWAECPDCGFKGNLEEFEE